MEDKKWVEIISVRLFSPGQQKVVQKIFREVNSGISKVADKAVAAELYVSKQVETDWAVYLYQTRSDGAVAKTLLGLNIAEAFCSLGLVNHSVWAMELMKKERSYEEK